MILRKWFREQVRCVPVSQVIVIHLPCVKTLLVTVVVLVTPARVATSPTRVEARQGHSASVVLRPLLQASIRVALKQRAIIVSIVVTGVGDSRARGPSAIGPLVLLLSISRKRVSTVGNRRLKLKYVRVIAINTSKWWCKEVFPPKKVWLTINMVFVVGT